MWYFIMYQTGIFYWLVPYKIPLATAPTGKLHIHYTELMKDVAYIITYWVILRHNYLPLAKDDVMDCHEPRRGQ